ncbi:hypothetical protein [Sphingobium sp. B11D3A]|uniref:hypothetical protein n=1 Tax=Sphingobium sp. B11D3A TaxID=2940574 RepID=UPI0022246ECE|nr:hypothetical protein [Sphingobium sp. B11D3A]MCW2393525.1 hypothetical protein [Sphingobium sp. B11D3A]
MSERAPVFGDLGDFTPRKSSARMDPKTLDQIAKENGFPSRSAREEPGDKERIQAQPRQGRRYTTGRNRQINVKATEETINLLYSVADELNQPLGAVLELALKALVAQRSEEPK